MRKLSPTTKWQQAMRVVMSDPRLYKLRKAPRDKNLVILCHDIDSAIANNIYE